MSDHKTNLHAQDFLVSVNSMIEHQREAGRCRVSAWEALKKVRKLLDRKEYAILKMRYRDRMTLEEVGRELSVTRERIRQIEAKAIMKLKIADPMDNMRYSNLP